MDINKYITERFDDQLKWFDSRAIYNQSRYLLMRRIMLIASWLTPIAIFLQLVVPAEWHNWRDYWAIVPMVLSTVAVGSYQWEEVHNYGSQWSKFRLVAEALKHQKAYYEYSAGPFRDVPPEEAIKMFVVMTEKIVEGTDINYFTLVVDPHRGPSES